MKRKKVLCLIPSFGGGGAERQMTELINCLNDNGIEVSVITNSPENVYSHEIPATRYNINETNRLLCLVKTYFLIRSLKFDSLISFGDKSNLTAILSSYPFKRFRLIVSERNFTINLGWKDRLRFFLFKRVDYIVSNNKSQANFISKNFKALNNKIKTIHNFTDVSIFKAKFKKNNNQEIIKVGIFARYAPQKNITSLIKAAAILKRTNNNIYRFYWFGKKYLEDKNSSILLPTYVSAHKLVLDLDLEKEFLLNSFSKKPEYDINDMDVISLPSFHEGFSNSISEALACGKPVIASDVSDNSIIVERNIEGFLFDPHNINSIVDAFRNYSELNTQAKKTMSLNARKKAEKLFSKEIFAAEYIDLII